MSTSKHVFLVEDDHQLREALKRVLELEAYVVHSFPDPTLFLSYGDYPFPSVIVSDMRMPQMTGLELQEKIITQGRNIPMIMISGESTDAQIIATLKNGAIDFLLKPFARDSLLRAIAKGIEIDFSAMNRSAQQAKLDLQLQILAPREREVFSLLAQGYSNQEVMSTLKISLPTVKQYKSAVMQKLQLKSLSQLIALNQSGI